METPEVGTAVVLTVTHGDADTDKLTDTLVELLNDAHELSVADTHALEVKELLTDTLPDELAELLLVTNELGLIVLQPEEE